MKIIHKDTNLFPFSTIFAAEKHAKQNGREIYSVYALTGGTIIYSAYNGNEKVWFDREGDLPADFHPFKEGQAHDGFAPKVEKN